MKKIITFISLVFVIICSGTMAFAGDSQNPPKVNCYGLPGCVDSDKASPSNADISKDVSIDLVGNIISQVIQYVAIIAVISLMLSGIMYLLSGGEEEKVKKAKSWIIWSLAGVLLSISAWSIIKIINSIII